MARRVCIGGNWKCNGTVQKVKELTEMLNSVDNIPQNVDVIVAPPAFHLGSVLEGLRKDIKVAIQNCWSEPKAGAWTGEITADLIRDFGVEWVILGHSERRSYCGESNDVVGKKVDIALNAGLNVIACIGETLVDREAGRTMEVCAAQLAPIFTGCQIDEQLDKIVIAYEPVWAIGTGVTASPALAQETHRQIREWIAENVSKKASLSIRILYGGSVNALNCRELIANADIDGFLVGGASLKPDFKDIIACGSTE